MVTGNHTDKMYLWSYMIVICSHLHTVYVYDEDEWQHWTNCCI